jgi:hypothetical protein
MSGISYPIAQHHIPEDWHLLQNIVNFIMQSSFHFIDLYLNRLRWSRGSVLAFSTQVYGFIPGRSHQIFKGKKVLSTPSFGGEVKPLGPCHRNVACKRSLNGVEVIISAKITGQHSRPQFHLPLLGSLVSWRTWGHLVAKVGTSKHGRKKFAQDAVYQSHKSRLTELWSLPRPSQELNTYNNNLNQLGPAEMICLKFGLQAVQLRHSVI